MHRFVHHQTQFKLDVLCHRQPMQPITNQAGDVLNLKCTKELQNFASTKVLIMRKSDRLNANNSLKI